jgi:hypothetical protein
MILSNVRWYAVENDGFEFGRLDIHVLVLWLQILLTTCKYSAIAVIHTHWSSAGTRTKTQNYNSLTESHTPNITHE